MEASRQIAIRIPWAVLKQWRSVFNRWGELTSSVVTMMVMVLEDEALLTALKGRIRYDEGEDLFKELT